MRVATMLGTAGLALLASGAAAQDVTYDYDKTANFAGFKTYAWVDGRNVKDELNHKRIVAAVDAQLAARGFTKVEAGASPDVLVAYNVGFGQEVQISGYAPGYRPAARWGSARAEQVLVGALGVEIVDAKTRTMTWRAIARKDLDEDASPEKRERNLNKAVAKMFEKYPPEA
ncbi:MAG TPA: DUF4136 domain-containing protein [Gemmatimonadales bacterium]|jgi:hypothetical protein|nr:DUF4136 domain-containing protein [Gemmatimonadales bacterium]